MYPTENAALVHGYCYYPTNCYFIPFNKVSEYITIQENKEQNHDVTRRSYTLSVGLSCWIKLDDYQ